MALKWAERMKRQTDTSRRWRTKNPRAVWSYWLKTTYSINADEYELILWFQHGKCALCDATSSGVAARPRLFVDHDHSRCCPSYRSCRKCVRGLLCLRCNSHPVDSADQLQKFHEYVTWPPAQMVLP